MSIVSGSMGAVMASDAQDEATKAQSASAEKSAANQLAMYDQSRADFAPFLAPSAQAMATLQSGVSGKPMQYVDPTYQKVSSDEINKRNQMFAYAKNYGALSDPSKTYYKDADGNYTTTPKMLTAEYTPTESEGFKYTKQRTLEDLGRTLRMMGRGSGTVAANTESRTLGDLNAANEDKYKNDLLNMAKIGQGAAGSSSTLGQSTANSLSSLAQAQGNAQAQGYLNKANLYAGMGNQSANAVGTAYQGYKLGQGLGLFGSEAAAGTTGMEAADLAALA